jgi:hypothetical protein
MRSEEPKLTLARALQNFIARHPLITNEEEMYRVSTALFPAANSTVSQTDVADTRARIAKSAMTMGN